MDKSKIRSLFIKSKQTTIPICDICGTPVNLNIAEYELIQDRVHNWKVYHSKCLLNNRG